MNDRLKWLFEQLQKLQDDDRIRYEGWTVFQGAKAELADIIANPVAEVAPIVNRTMAPGELEALAESAAKAVREMSQQELMTAVKDVMTNLLGGRLEAIAGGILAVVDEIHASDAALMGAVEAKGNDIIAAIPH
jgi:hypothetical protein